MYMSHVTCPFTFMLFFTKCINTLFETYHLQAVPFFQKLSKMSSKDATIWFWFVTRGQVNLSMQIHGSSGRWVGPEKSSIEASKEAAKTIRCKAGSCLRFVFRSPK